MSRPLLLITGVQKSGTTLLNRLVQEAGIASSPFHGEGNEFWGNEPPFSPKGDPAGTVYLRHHGERGHEIGAEEALDPQRVLLERRLADLAPAGSTVVNKNPYNAVRLGWLRALFPDAVIVAMVRDPVANAYSLAKKHVPHKERGLAPEDGWWGVKPSGWRALIDDDKVLQSARQWDAVNRRLLADRAGADRIIAYSALCARPADLLADIDRLLHGEARAVHVEPLACFDDEFARGAPLRSRNRYYKELGSLRVPEAEEIEFPALRTDQVEAVRAVTGATWSELCRVTGAS